jgi:AcrR family transcriptional regulator
MATPRTAKPKTKATRKAKVPLSRERALAAAVALADREGIGALTMRKLADELGVEAMSLYHHVANKEQILDGMVDIVFAEIDLPRSDIGWKAAMRERGRSVRAALNRHPWSISICCLAAGFSLPMTAHAFSMIDSYIFGFVMQEVNLPFDNGDDLHDLAASMEPLFAAGNYPHFIEFVTGHALQPGYAYGDEFDFGLGLILDGLEAAARKERRAK